jgi:hypothetical protein
MDLRDFIYLDTERLRSFTAQLLGGVPETGTSERGHEVGGAAAAEAGLWKFVRAQGEADYRYHRTGTETRSLHHHVYSLFEDALEAEGLLENVDSSFSYVSWTPAHFKDGAFVKVRGRVRFVDYSQSIAALESFPTLFKSFKAVQLANIKNAAESGDLQGEEAATQRRQLEAMDKEFRTIPVQHFSTLGQALYSPGAVRLKIHPDGAPPRCVFAGNGRLESLIDALGAGGVTESPPTAQWVAVGQVAAAMEEGALSPIPTGNAMEDAIEAISGGFRELANVGSGAVFPGIALTPLAVYREVVK